MNSLKHIRDQLVATWNRSSKATRAIYAAVSGVCLLLIFVVGIWSSRPQMVPLATNLSPAQAARIIDLLDAEKITNKMNFSGSTVLVPKKDFSRARLVIKDLAGLPTPPLEEESRFPGFMPDPDRSLKRREQQIAQVLMRMNAIKHASVTLAFPNPTPFVREMKPTTAAVVLELNPSVPFTRTIGSSVVLTVSRSVPGLLPENVTVADTNGRMLSSGAEGNGDLTNQLDFQRWLEADIAAKAQWMLAEVLGEGAAVVSVRADIDFRETVRSNESYDQDSSGKIKEKFTSEKLEGSRRVRQGSPGTSSNLERISATDRDSPVTSSFEETESDFAPGKSAETVKEHGGTIKRLSVAATVDLAQAKENSGATYTKEQIEGLVKQAVGFDEQRNDQFTLVTGKIVGAIPPVDELDSGVPWWHEYERLIRSLSLGLAALVAFVIGLLVIRKLRPIALVGSSGDASERRRSELVDQLSSKVRENPEAVSRILAAWLNDPGRAGDQSGADAASKSAAAFEHPRRRAA